MEEWGAQIDALLAQLPSAEALLTAPTDETLDAAAMTEFTDLRDDALARAQALLQAAAPNTEAVDADNTTGLAYQRDELAAALHSETLLVERVPAEQVAAAERAAADLERREHVAHAGLEREARRVRAELAALEDAARARHAGDQADLAVQFARAEAELVERLRRRGAEVSAATETLSLRGGKALSRTWRVADPRAPQPCRVAVIAIRGLPGAAPASAVPPGRYIVTASLLDRLGGSRLRWSALVDHFWRGTTRPVPLAPGARTLAVEQCVFAVVPGRARRPLGVCLLLQVVPAFATLDAAVATSDLADPPAVAWGVLPLRNLDGSLARGRFRIPLLAGPVDWTVTRFSELDARLDADLSAWAGNLYCELTPQQRTGADEPVGITVDNAFPEVAQPFRFDTHFYDVASKERDDKGPAPALPTSPPPQLRRPSTTLTLGSTSASAANQPPSALTFPAPRAADLMAQQPTFTASLLGMASTQSSGDGPALATCLHFTWTSFRDTLGLSRRAWTPEVLLSLVVLIGFFWVRLWVHYLGQFVLVRSWGQAVAGAMELRPFALDLAYYELDQSLGRMIGLVLVGPAVVLVLFLALAATAIAAAQWLPRAPPRPLAVLASVAGLHAVLDPLLILLVDLARERWAAPGPREPTGDAFKLYWHFRRTSGSGVAGAVLVVFLYLLATIVALVVWLAYLWRWHAGSGARDLLRRITAPALQADAAVPWDCEVSPVEVAAATASAARWRGPRGARRVVAVVQYTTTTTTLNAAADTADEAATDSVLTTHVSVHTISPVDDSTQCPAAVTLHRHFLQLPAGQIVELDAAAAAAGADHYDKSTLLAADDFGGYGGLDAAVQDRIAELRLPPLARLVAHARAVLPRAPSAADAALADGVVLCEPGVYSRPAIATGENSVRRRHAPRPEE